jgi:hypothetical protein
MPARPDKSVRPISRLVIAALVAIGMLAIRPGPVAAQRLLSRKSPAAAAAKKPDAVKVVPARTEPTAEDAAAVPTAEAPPAKAVAAEAAPREETPEFTFTAEPAVTSAALRPFLTGDDWQDALLRFEQWLQVQALYDAEQVKQMRAKFAARAKAASTGDRKAFIKEVDAKLEILYSSRTMKLQDQFAEILSAAAPAYAKKLRQPLPDVVSSTPAQLREQLSRLALRHQSTVEMHQTFDQMRQNKIASNEATAEARHNERPRPSAGQVASSSSGPSKKRYTQARDYYPPSGHSITYSVIPAMPMMTNSGWAMFGGGVAITMQRNR